MLKATKETLPEIVAEHDVVLVDFWAEWCGPCKAMEPVLEQLDASGEVVVVKVNVDEEVELRKQYEIMGIPTFALFKGGQLNDTISGARPLRQLEAFVSGE